MIVSYLLVFVINTGTIIELCPTSQAVAVKEWSNFTCSANFSEGYTLRWRLAVPNMDAVSGRYPKVQLLKKIWKKRGIAINFESTSSESGDYKEETVMILATPHLDGAVIQCAAKTRSGVPSYTYSKFAILQVDHLPETTMSSGSNETAAFPPQ